MPWAGPAGKSLKLHVFFDRSVLEAFLGEGTACVTKVIRHVAEDLRVEAFAEGGTAELVSLQAWELRPIW